MSMFFKCTVGNCSEIFYKREEYEMHTSNCSHEKQKSSGLVGTAAKNLSSEKLKPRSTPPSIYYRCTHDNCGKVFDDKASYETHTTTKH